MVRLMIALVLAVPFRSGLLAAQRPKEVLRIPASESTEPLPPLSDVEVSEDGQIFVLHPTENSVAVYDIQGRKVARIGREGSGPGEFRFPAQAQAIGGTISVWDPALRRPSWFDGNFRFARSNLLNVGGLVFPLGENAFVAEANPRNSTFVPIVVIDSTGTLVRTIDTIDQSHRVLVVGTPGRQFQSLQPFTDHTLWAVDARHGRIAIVERFQDHRTGTFDLTLVSGVGDTLFSTTIRQPSVRLTDAIAKTAARKLYASLISGFPQQQIGVSVTQIETAMYKPTFLPLVHAVTVSSSGDIWLGLAAHPDAPNRSWVVVDSTGRTKANVSLPAALEIRRVYGERIWGVVLDEDGSPIIYSYELSVEPS